MIIDLKNNRHNEIRKSRRNRECCFYNKKIVKDEKYNYSSFRYDKTIISMYSHLTCKKINYVTD